MKGIFRSRYVETLNMLKMGIEEGEVFIEEKDARTHTCFYCRDKINGPMLLVTYGKLIVGVFPFHPKCYDEFRE